MPLCERNLSNAQPLRSFFSVYWRLTRARFLSARERPSIANQELNCKKGIKSAKEKLVISFWQKCGSKPSNFSEEESLPSRRERERDRGRGRMLLLRKNKSTRRASNENQTKFRLFLFPFLSIPGALRGVSPSIKQRFPRAKTRVRIPSSQWNPRSSVVDIYTLAPPLALRSPAYIPIYTHAHTAPVTLLQLHSSRSDWRVKTTCI